MRFLVRPHRGMLIVCLIALLGAACERPFQTGEPVQIEPINTEIVIPTQQSATPEGGVEVIEVEGEAVTTEEQAETGGEQAEGGDTAAGSEPTTTPESETTVQRPENGIYIVQAGDTVGAIAQRFGISIQDIAQANNLVNVDILDVGDELVIPEPGAPVPTPATEGASSSSTAERVHIVQAGETLFRIGQTYGFTVEELRAYNNLINADQLDVGQEIKIPPSE